MRETKFLSLLSDGSTDAGIIEQESVFVRYVDKQGQPCTKFLDIVALESATADARLFLSFEQNVLDKNPWVSDNQI